MRESEEGGEGGIGERRGRQGGKGKRGRKILTVASNSFPPPYTGATR